MRKRNWRKSPQSFVMFSNTLDYWNFPDRKITALMGYLLCAKVNERKLLFIYYVPGIILDHFIMFSFVSQ